MCRSRNLLHTAFAVAMLLTAAQAVAQNYPSRPIRLIVAWPPPGAVDIRERLLPLAYELHTSTPQALSSPLKAETEKWAKVVKASGAKLD